MPAHKFLYVTICHPCKSLQVGYNFFPVVVVIVTRGDGDQADKKETRKIDVD